MKKGSNPEFPIEQAKKMLMQSTGQDPDRCGWSTLKRNASNQIYRLANMCKKENGTWIEVVYKIYQTGEIIKMKPRKR